VAQVRGTGVIDLAAAERTLTMLGIDSDGLDPMDRRILMTIIDKFGGGPVGLGTIGAALGEEVETIEEVYEPYMIQQGFMSRTQRGRMATRNAYRKFNIVPPRQFDLQAELPLI
jgi:Holliday junction DNA helicase RuvB